MRCAVMHGRGDLRVEECEIPKVGAGDILIRVSVCGVCHTDIPRVFGSYPIPELPFVLGHEYSGIVVTVGEKVARFRAGDHVTVKPYLHCGLCSYCRRGINYLCTQKRALHGGFAEYTVKPEELVYRLPDGLSDLAASNSEPVSACLHAVEQAGVAPGDTIVVVGGGPIGLTLVQLARLAGAAQVLLSDPVAARRELGRRLGADMVVDPNSEKLEDVVAEATNGIGADSAFEAAGLPETVEQCLPVLRRGGTAVVVGVAEPRALARISPFQMFLREQTLRGSIGDGNSFERAIQLLPKLSLDPLFTHEFKLEDIRQAIEVRRGVDCLKSFIRP